MITVNYDEFSQVDFKYAFEINKNFEIDKQVIDDLTIITINDFFADPNAVVETLKKFPVQNKDRFFEELQQSEDPNQFMIKPPGEQQIIPNSYLEGVSFILYKLLVDYDFVEKDYWAEQDMNGLSNQIAQFSYYTNIFRPNMKNWHNNFMPRFDQSMFGFNVYLSEEEIGGGTSFYNLKFKDEKYPSVVSLAEIDDLEDRVELSKLLNSLQRVDDLSPETYISIPDNHHVFERYHTAPFKFNTLTAYKGSFWHNADYDASTEKNLRYSLACSYTPAEDLNYD